ncbi:hypothetical protein ABVT39_017999 [Epinephelus coioides]
MQMLKDILTSSKQPSEQPSTSSSWSLRQTAAQDEWRKARAHHTYCLLFCNEVPEKKCSHCTSPAIIRCRDCMPDEWLCMDCDIQIHTKLTLHNRDSCIEGIYKPIKPTVCCAKKDGVYSLVSQGRYDLHMPNLLCRLCLAQWTPDRGDLIKSGYWVATVHADTLFSMDVFSTFEEMKTVAPSLSRQAFLRMLESRTVHFGRDGKIHRDVFQQSFVEYTFCQYQCDRMANVEQFTCPACTPNMLALCADGNRKQYRFRQSKGSEEPYFDGTFISKDADVHHFVEDVRCKIKSTAGRGTCGASQWSAARKTARRASKLDEEGLEVVVCRHGVLLKALNMYRGEIFAYPLFLQKELQATTKGQFYCTDIACKYWPYLKKLAASMMDLRPLLQMRPFLSVMHAKAHSTKCEIIWSSRNQEGAGTAAGEEVEMVNSYLSRCALTTKYMTKSDSAGSRCDDLQQSIEQMFLGVHQKKARLYTQTDSNKIRHLRRRKLGEEKKKLLEMIKLNNEQVPHEEWIDVEKVESRLSVVGPDSGTDLIWPWEVHSSDSSNILTKKKIFDAYMSKVRLEEEKEVLVKTGIMGYCVFFRKGLQMWRKSSKSYYSQALGPNASSLLEDGPEEILEDHKEFDYESSDDSDFEAV